MSLSLAKTWVDSMVGLVAARVNALEMLDQAASEKKEATLIVGSRISANGKCYFGRWDGQELVVRELTARQQQYWSINPDGLSVHLDSPTALMPLLCTEPLVSLSIAQIDKADCHDGWGPMTGTCVAEFNKEGHQVIDNCALRAEYFRPDLKRRVTTAWYAHECLSFASKELKFHFPPLFTDRNSQSCHGSLVVFLRLFTAQNWVTNIGCRCISNVADAEIWLR